MAWFVTYKTRKNNTEIRGPIKTKYEAEKFRASTAPIRERYGHSEVAVRKFKNTTEACEWRDAQ